MLRVPGGAYEPLYALAGEGTRTVAAFWLDERAVTNAEFLEFVTRHPRWRRSQAPRVFVDAAYLSDWSGDLALGDAPPDRPITFVPWFAASAYCRSLGKRLPSEAEWELAANPPAASEQARAEARRVVLAFYARPRGPLPRAGLGAPNEFGVRDLHGVIWEWVEDWNSALVPGDERESKDARDERFCGGGVAGASEADDYAAFMRFAFRASLEATYALHHLGFRCARSAP
jgi:formylglycine-generating enzyme required for sulfatase activity